MPSIIIITLGCKVNQYESEYVREGFAMLGYREVGDSEDGRVELIVVNTCTVTAESEAKCRKTIRRLAKKHPEAEIVVLGCYAARAPEEAASLPGVSEVVADKRDLPELLRRRGLAEVPNGISRFEDRHRAWVKVQDGCRQHCTYCIVPLVRPHLSSRPVEEVLDEISRLTSAGQISNLSPKVGQISNLSPEVGQISNLSPEVGQIFNLSKKVGQIFNLSKKNQPTSNPSYSEIVLTGIHLGHYGVEQPEPRIDLAGLVARILALPGEFRSRFSSIEAGEVTPELLRMMADRPDRICPHLHLPLQSGSDPILEKMKRRLPTTRFLEICEEIRSRLDRPALTTDVIVGFPGETEADFDATCRTVEAAGFSKTHVFRFSPREGTAAAEMKNRVPQRVHQHWAATLGNLGDRLRANYVESLVGSKLQVLIEGVDHKTGRLQGTADRYVTVDLDGHADWEGRLIHIEVTSAKADRLEGKPISPSL
jgi:threonylcarbamoyladenosine tRNA methylthiotransferase MtaB